MINNEVRGLFQDKKGAMYITTPSGISIFDGYRFKNFNYKNGIEFDYIKHMMEQENGAVCLFANTGRKAYIFENNDFIKTIATPNIITQYFKGRDQKDYVCTDIGIYEMKDNNFIKKKISNDSSILTNSFFKYLEINDSIAVALRVYPANEFVVLNTKKRTILFKKKDFLAYHLLKDLHNRIWVSTDNQGIKMFDEKALANPEHLFTSTPVALNTFIGVQINNAAEDRQGNIWFATTGKGLIKYDTYGKCTLFSTKNGLLSNSVLKVFVDQNDHLWIGTSKGLQFLTNQESVLFDQDAGLKDDAVYAAAQLDEKRFLVTTNHHLSIIDAERQLINSTSQPYFEDGYIFKLLNTQQNNFWGLTSRRIMKINMDSNQPIIQSSSQSKEYLMDILVLKDGTVLILSQTKVYQYTKSEFFPLYNNLPDTKTILEDQNGNLWIGTVKGIYILKKEAVGKKYHLTDIVTGYKPENAFEIKILCKDLKENIWAGSKEHGIYQLQLKDGKMLQMMNITREMGLSNNSIKYLLWQNDSTLISSGTSGVDRIVFEKNRISISNINSILNLAGSAYSIIYEKAYNNLLFPGLMGLLITKVNDHNYSSALHKLSFTNCMINNHSVADLFNKEEIEFSNNENSPEFYFSDYNYQIEKHLFYYWLDNGGPEKWQPITNANFIRLSNLPHDHYTLYIKEVNKNNEKEFITISKRFKIKPLYYQTLLFKIAVGALALLLGIYYVKRRISNLKKEAAIKQQITETAMAALKAQMNPHFMFNCINSIDAFIQTNDKYQATLYLNKFAKLLRNILESSKQNTVQLSKDIDTLKLYVELEELRNENKFKTAFQIEEDLLYQDYKVPPLIIQPFVENAILHGLKNREGNAGILEIGIKKVGDIIEYTIKDNGIGRKAAGLMAQNKESSYGMQMSYDRIKLFNQEKNASVTIKDLMQEEQPAGTAITVHLKIK